MSLGGCARRSMRSWRGAAALALAGLLFCSGTWADARPFPVSENRTGLPAGSELDADAIDNPREVLYSETIHGHKSYLSNLAFNSPYVLGDAARSTALCLALILTSARASAEPSAAPAFCADVVSRDAAGSAVGTAAGLYVANRKVRIETSAPSAGFFVIDGEAGAAHQAQRRVGRHTSP
jgi:hypothetical protein